MLKILTATSKELLLLKRDRTGLLILFIMPALLVIVITLVQQNVMELTGQERTEVLFLDLDEGELGRALLNRLEGANIDIVTQDGTEKTAADLGRMVESGDYQVGIVIAEGSSAAFKMRAGRLYQTESDSGNDASLSAVAISLFFDPGVLPGFRTGVKVQLQLALEAIAMEAKAENLGKELDRLFSALDIPEGQKTPSVEEFVERMNRPLLSLDDGHEDSGTREEQEYNPVQQNVPAWAIFGMFFTAIPIAGTILQERKSGIWVRLNSLPVSHLQLISGKALAYIGVCLCQFVLIGLIGHIVFPQLGLPSFIVFPHLLPVLLTIFFISLAACGFGIFLGSICNSYEQASALGACFVVVAAALGGVMVPVYAMPEVMQRLSIVSPLNWGLSAFQDLLVRGHSLAAIADDLGRLAVFFLLTIIFAWKLSRLRI